MPLPGVSFERLQPRVQHPAPYYSQVRRPTHCLSARRHARHSLYLACGGIPFVQYYQIDSADKVWYTIPSYHISSRDRDVCPSLYHRRAGLTEPIELLGFEGQEDVHLSCPQFCATSFASTLNKACLCNEMNGSARVTSASSTPRRSGT